MPELKGLLVLGRCPHCSVANPNLTEQTGFQTTNYKDANRRFWKVYRCARCGGALLAAARNQGGEIIEIYPSTETVDNAIPAPAREFLQQAIESLHAPAGAAMLAASAVDAMLKNKGYKKGTLNERIGAAAHDHLITPEMAKWAHEVRLDANEPRHADETNPLPSEEAAKKTVHFAQALGEFLFVLPGRVARGLKEAGSTE